MKLSIVAAVVSATLFASVAGAQGTAYYTATPATAPTKASVITRSTAWTCAGTTCVANKAPERDAILCALVAQKVGKLAAFTVAGASYDPAALDKCNARAK